MEPVELVGEAITPLGSFNVRNIVERVVWTFVQAFIGSLPATIPLVADDARAISASALAAGIAAVVSLAKNLTGELVVVQASKRAAA